MTVRIKDPSERCNCNFTKENEYKFSINCPAHSEVAKANMPHEYVPGDCVICGESKDSAKHYEDMKI